MTEPQSAEAVRASDRAHGPAGIAHGTAGLLTYGQLAEAMAKFAAPSRPKLRELHCHPRVTEHLRETSTEAEPAYPGAIGSLTGIPVIEHDDMEPGTWELREDGEVIHSGKLRTWEEVIAERISAMLPEGMRFEWK